MAAVGSFVELGIRAIPIVGEDIFSDPDAFLEGLNRLPRPLDLYVEG